MSKFKLLLKGSALRTVESVVAIACGFLTLPLMLNGLGEEVYGVWVLAGSFTALMYIFDMGFASAVTRNVTQAISKSDHDQANKIINSSLYLYSFLALLITLFVIAFAFFYQPDISSIVSKEDLRTVIILMGLTIALEFPVKAFAGVATAHYRYDLLAGYRIALKLASTGTLVLLLFSGYKLVALATLHFTFGILGGLAYFVIAKCIYKEMRFGQNYFSLSSIKELFSYSSWAFLIDINQALKHRIDLFFIGGFISLTAVSVYYVSVRLVEYTMQLLYKGLNITLPVLAAHDANEDKEKFREDLLLFNRINCYFSVITFSMFMFFGKSILFYWMGKSFDFLTAYHILIILLLGRLSSLVTNGFTTGLYAKGQHKLLAFISILETISSTALLYIGLSIYEGGIVVVAYAIAVPLMIFRLFFLPYLSIKLMAVKNASGLIFSSYRPLLMMIVLIPIWYLLLEDAHLMSYKFLAATALSFCFLVAFLAVDLTRRETDLIKQLVSRKH